MLSFLFGRKYSEESMNEIVDRLRYLLDLLEPLVGTGVAGATEILDKECWSSPQDSGSDDCWLDSKNRDIRIFFTMESSSRVEDTVKSVCIVGHGELATLFLQGMKSNGRVIWNIEANDMKSARATKLSKIVVQRLLHMAGWKVQPQLFSDRQTISRCCSADMV